MSRPCSYRRQSRTPRRPPQYSEVLFTGAGSVPAPVMLVSPFPGATMGFTTICTLRSRLGFVLLLGSGLTGVAVGMTRPPRAQEAGPPGETIAGGDPVDEELAASVCLDLSWAGEPSTLSDSLVSSWCEVVDAEVLLATGETSWSWVLYRRESVFAAGPDTPPEDLDLFPDTIPEDELVLFVGRPDESSVRPVWHDRTDRRFEFLSAPEALALDDRTALLSHQRCLSGTGGCMDYPYRLTEEGPIVALEPRYQEEILARLPDEWGTWKGFWLDLSLHRVEAPVYIPGDANCCPSFHSLSYLRLTGDTLFADSVAVFPERGSSTWQVVPGERFGLIDPQTSEADLRELAGREMVRSDEVYLAEGFCTDGTRLFAEMPYEVEVAWADSARTQPAFVRSRSAEGPWRTPSGVGVGTTLAELERLKGEPLSFSGFGWDYGGMTTWEEDGGAVRLRLAIHPSSYERLGELARTDPRTEEIDGDRTVTSDHPVIRQITVIVEEIDIDFDRPFVERDCDE